MLTKSEYDLVIIGAGCAGLSLAHRLVGKNYKVCILESSADINLKNKLWSFWDTYETPYDHIIKKEWESLVIKNQNSLVNINCKKYKYKSLDSHVFNNFILNLIDKNDNINFISSSKVKSLSTNKSEVIVKTKDHELKCKHVFDSRPENIKVSMWQQFFGAYVESEEDIFDDEKPMFMEFSGIEDKFHFIYLLPFSKREALIESTYFSQEKEDQYLDKKYIEEYVKENYSQSNFKIRKTEYGSIPMDANIKNSSTKSITKIGSFSGATRASTGYTFINIQKQVDNIINHLPDIISKRRKIKKNYHSYILRKMDEVFLKIVNEEPRQMKNALIKLFSSNNNDAQIRFLSDIPSIIDIVKITLSLPKKIFLKYSFIKIVKK